MADSLPAHVDDPKEASLPPGHELKDISAGGIVLTAVGLLLTVMVCFLVAWWLYEYLNALDRSTKPPVFPLAVQEQGRLPPPPLLEGLEGMNTAVRPGEVQTSNQRRLETYGWVDRQTGIVRIPIDRAMKIIVEQNRQPAAGGAVKGE